MFFTGRVTIYRLVLQNLRLGRPLECFSIGFGKFLTIFGFCGFSDPAIAPNGVFGFFGFPRFPKWVFRFFRFPAFGQNGFSGFLGFVGYFTGVYRFLEMGFSVFGFPALVHMGCSIFRLLLLTVFGVFLGLFLVRKRNLITGFLAINRSILTPRP